jgi:hypothetical protein
MKNYFEKNEEENFESIVGGKHHKINSTFTPIGRADSRIRRFWPLHMKSKIEEIKVWRSQRLKKSKFWRSWRLKKSKLYEVKMKSKIWSLETQPESTTQVESRGLLTCICPLGIHGLVYRVRPIMEVDWHKDSKIDLETKKEGSNPYSTRTLVKP